MIKFFLFAIAGCLGCLVGMVMYAIDNDVNVSMLYDRLPMQTVNAGSLEESRDYSDLFFPYYTKCDGSVDKYRSIREKAKELAQVIVNNTPDSHKRVTSIRLLRESIVVASSAIACDQEIQQDTDHGQ